MAEKRPQFGNRLLTEEKNVFEHNAWDNVVWDEEQEKEAQEKVDKNSQKKVAPDMREKYEDDADKFWDDFYTQHQNRFFKDRHWLFTEFPELSPNAQLPDTVPLKVNLDQSKSDDQRASENQESQSVASSTVGATAIAKSDYIGEENFPGEHGSFRLLEVGCGVGNTVFPVLQTNNDPGLFVYCCDLSSTAIDLVKEHADYNKNRCHAFVCDVTDTEAKLPFPPESLDIIILIFVLSAIHPDKMQLTIDRLAASLKPGGMIIFRDYGRYDLAQLRFKDGRCLQDNFYVRGDGTRVYFFTQDELRSMFTKAKLVEEQNLVDRRLQVNRGRQLKMYRVWIQCKYRKPAVDS